jgi:hypothetical protein
MKKIEFTKHSGDDRFIRVTSDDGLINDINFMQGNDDDALEMLMESKANLKLTRWLQLRGVVGRFLPLDYDQLNNGLWLYYSMFIDKQTKKTLIDGVEWCEINGLWYNSETLEAVESLPKNGTILNLPKEQRDIIIKALRLYSDCYNRFNQLPTDNEAEEIFDLNTLIGLMHYNVEVSINKNDSDNFVFEHGVDLPIYL